MPLRLILGALRPGLESLKPGLRSLRPSLESLRSGMGSLRPRLRPLRLGLLLSPSEASVGQLAAYQARVATSED